MAIPLNKIAIRCKEIAIAGGKINSNSSTRTLIYDISRHWRQLLESSGYQSDNPGPWSESEELAAEVMVSALTYLQCVGCKNIEQLLKDTIEQRARQNE